jgi:2-hydroxy-4-(methylsulfanyl)butanoate S-methyltransferase
MVYTPDGVGMTPDFVVGHLKRAGFTVEMDDDLIPGMTRVITARK